MIHLDLNKGYNVGTIETLCGSCVDGFKSYPLFKKGGLKPFEVKRGKVTCTACILLWFQEYLDEYEFPELGR